MKGILIDNYDSFTYNLLDLVYRASGIQCDVLKNDDLINLEKFIGYDFGIISPEPGHPLNDSDVGISKLLFQIENLPILGVCLGHQLISIMFNSIVEHAAEPVHGLPSAIIHSGDSLFLNIPNHFQAIRYHSYVVKNENLSLDLEVIAWLATGEVMSIKHKTLPIYGVQFHPESIKSEYGDLIIKNFLEAIN